MTNFEKWKESLTPEEAADCLIAVDCRRCPALKYCRIIKSKSCFETFVEWAKQEYKTEKENENGKQKKIHS